MTILTREPAQRARHHVLPSATYDIVVGPSRLGHPMVVVDPNYKAEGPNVHEVNTDGEYGRAMAAVLRDTIEGREGTHGLHNSYNKSYQAIQHGKLCIAIFDGIGKAAADALQVSFTSDWAFSGLSVVKGKLVYQNNPVNMWYYSDFEISHRPDSIKSDLKRLRNLMGGSLEDTLSVLESHWIRYPTGNWQTPDASVPGLLTKSGFYGQCLVPANGVSAPVHAVLSLEVANAETMKREITRFISDNHESLTPGRYLVIKPDVGCTRAMGVRTIHVDTDGKVGQDVIDEVANFLFDPHRVYSRHAPPTQWLIEFGVERDVVQFRSGGKSYDLYYDLVPMVVAGSVVSVAAKVRSVETGQPLELMPGQNPAEIAFLGVGNPKDIPKLQEKYAAIYGVPTRDFAINEARGASALRDYLSGTEIPKRAVAAAEEVHQRSIVMLEQNLAELHRSLAGAKR